MSAKTPRGCILRALTLYGAFLLCALALWLVFGHVAAERMVRNEDRRWAAAGAPMDVFASRWPRQPDSASGRELDRLARPLGLPLVRDPGASAQIVDRPLYDAMGKWLSHVSREEQDRYEPPPAEVRRFLDGHRSELAAVAAHLASARDISWETDLDARPDPPQPQLLAHRYLSTLLLTEALARNSDGDQAEAERMLDAVWNQNATLAARPELLDRLVAIAVHGQLGSALRRLPAAAPSWDERLRRRQFRAAVIESFQHEAYSMLVTARTYRGTSPADAELLPVAFPFGSAFRFATAPFVRLNAAGASSYYRRGQELARASDLCRLSGEELALAVTREIAGWDFVARNIVPSVMRSVTAGVTADIDGELTRLVLQARRGSAAEAVPSTVCPGVTWRRVRGGDGLTIRADPAPTVDPSRRGRWRFRLAAARR